MESHYPAALYAKLHLGNPGDLEFYRAQCSGARNILELGCGYGRVLEALCDEPRTLVGLDADRAQLALAEHLLEDKNRKSLHLVQGDMQRFEFAQKFDRILLPYSGIYCLLEEPHVERCLLHVARHLTPDGQFIFDAYGADDFHRDPTDQNEERDEAPEDVATLVHDGITYEVSEQTRWWRDEQRMDVVYIHEPREGGHSIATPLKHRYLLTPQIEPLLNKAGLKLTSLKTHFLNTSPTDHIIVSAQLA